MVNQHDPAVAGRDSTPPSPALTSPRQRRRAGRWVLWLPGLLVGIGAAVATAHGLYEVARAAEVPAGIAWLYPLITDGLAIVAYTAAAAGRLRGGAARYAWAVVVLAAGLSGLAQAAYLASGTTLAAAPLLRFGIGAWPAIAAAVVAHLLYLLFDSDEYSPADSSPVPAHYDHPEAPTIPAGPAERPDPDADADPTAPSASSLSRADEPAVPRQAGPSPVQTAVSNPAVHRSPSTADAPAVQPIVQPRPVAAVQPVPSVDGRSGAAPARAVARATALRHATRHGRLPTVSELQTAAEVSRGTAGTVLRDLRAQPLPLHLITSTPEGQDDITTEERTQP